MKVETRWGTAEVLETRLVSVVYDGFQIPPEEAEEYIGYVPELSRGTLQRCIHFHLERHSFKPGQEGIIGCATDYGTNPFCRWEIRFRIIDYHGPERCGRWMEIGKKEKMVWVGGPNNRFSVRYPRFECPQEELEYLAKNPVLFFDLEGDSAMSESYSEYFYERIEQLARRLGVPNPRPKVGPKKKKFFISKIKSSSGEIPFEIKEEKVWIQIGRKKVSLPLPLEKEGVEPMKEEFTWMGAKITAFYDTYEK